MAPMYLSQKAEVQVYCGRRLAMAMALVCIEPVTSERPMIAEKRSSIIKTYEVEVHKETSYRKSMNETLTINSENSINNDFAIPTIKPQKALIFARRKRQIVSECCDKACSIDEMKTYC
ncbi:jg2730 [Pararge aegeria aegeria]|uniref:Jg2730 protein n=1 Tax=Pararge aegeria aegeria TaxID=348720 RepID=A0A8S4QUI5_9NEOP|nr:jg2730 [Pararge aegeria aegeria]